MKRSSVRVVLSAIALLVISSITFGSFASASSSSGVISLSASTYNVSSLAGLIVVPVNRTAGTTGAVSVQYTTLQGSASYATDYSGEHGVLNWKSGDATPKSIIVKIYDAGPVSVKKLFSLKLSSPVGASLGTASATVTITESSASSSTVSLSASSYAVPRASGELTVAVARVGNVGSAGAVSFQTKEGSAVYGVDYGGIHGVLTWGAGDATPKSFKVHIDAPVATGNRSFAVELLSPSGVSLGSPSSATVTILGTQSAGSVPSAPSGVAANSGNALVSLTWSASSGATSYHVKRATTSGGPYSQVSAPTSVTYTDPALTNGTTYYYVVSAVDSAGESANSTQVSARPVAPTTGSTANACGMQLGTSAVIFCDTFDAPAGNGNRSGDLDGNVWGVSRTMGGGVALADLNNGGLYNRWNSTLINKCDGTTPRVNAPNDIIICNGQLREASNDNNTEQFDAGDVTALTMYPKQPFDFTGRTGTVSFDVSNDSYGVHSAWPEFWVSDLPVPAPFSHHQDWYSIPQNGFGVRFAATAPVGSYGLCPNGNNLDKLRWTVDSAVVIRNYVFEDINYAGVDFGTASAVPPTLTNLDCVLSSSGPGQMNHVEVRVSQNQIDVYATDAGVAATPTTLKHIAVITNANLTLTHGLIWLEDAHYNADKGAMGYPTQREHTFSWDNVAFDGPFAYRDFAYDALDNTAPGPNGSFNLGKYALANQTTSWNVSGIPANPQPEAVRVLFNFSMGVGATANPTTLTVIVNGHNHAVPWPYPDNIQSAWRTYAVTIPVTDLVAGTNVVQLGADVGVVYSNVDIVLADVPGGVPVLPGSNNAYPAH